MTDLADISSEALVAEIIRRRGAIDLTLCATADLLTELMGRYDHAVFGALTRMRGHEDDPRCEGMRRTTWRGNRTTCAGLGFAISHQVTTDLESEWKTDDPGKAFEERP